MSIAQRLFRDLAHRFRSSVAADTEGPAEQVTELLPSRDVVDRNPATRHSTVEDFLCDRTLFPGLSFPTMSLPTTPRNTGSSSTCKGNIPWFSSSAAEVCCPQGRQQAEGLVQVHREIEVAYCRLVTISTDHITQTKEYRSGVGAHWPFLSDAGRVVQKDLDIAEYTDPVNNPMIPHVIVLEPHLVIYKIYSGYWFLGPPTLEDLRQDLRAVTQKCRPDWDITLSGFGAWYFDGTRDSGHKFISVAPIRL